MIRTGNKESLPRSAITSSPHQWWNSVRVRLTLWNGALLVLLLAGSGLALCYRVHADLRHAVDQELAQDAERLAAHPPDRQLRPPEFARRPPPESRGPNHGLDWRRPRLLTPTGGAWGPFPEDRPWDRTTLALAVAGAHRYSTVMIHGEPVRIYSCPVIAQGSIVGVVQAAHPLGDLQRGAREQLRTLLTLIPLALLAAGLFGIFMTGRTLHPVRQITQAAAQIGAEDLSRRLKVTGPDEFGELAATFNGMIERLEQAFTRLESAYHRLERAYEQHRPRCGHPASPPMPPTSCAPRSPGSKRAPAWRFRGRARWKNTAGPCRW
jgi:HAMP domain-containing protein